MAALAARASMAPSGPAEDRFRLATWNVNSLKARAAALDRFLGRVRPDVLCVQETKASTLADAAAAAFERHGYHVAYAGHGAYNGVAIASLHGITDREASGTFDDEHLDREARLLACRIGTTPPVRVVSLYVPHGRSVGHWHYDYKKAFLERLAERVRGWLRADDSPPEHLVVAGDVNVAATDSDVFHPDAFVGHTHVTPSERAAWHAVLNAGLVDVDVARWGAHERRFTWWNHGVSYSRNLGMRLDVIAVDRGLAARVDTTWIDHVERGADRPSDHAALIADFDLTHAARTETRPPAPERRAAAHGPAVPLYSGRMSILERDLVTEWDKLSARPVTMDGDSDGTDDGDADGTDGDDSDGDTDGTDGGDTDGTDGTGA